MQTADSGESLPVPGLWPGTGIDLTSPAHHLVTPITRFWEPGRIAGKGGAKEDNWFK